MSDIIERLHTIRAHLRTGALGQREVWEEWLTEAGSEIERLQEEGTVELAKALLEIERLRVELADVRADAVLLRAEIERLRAACELFTEGAHDAVKALNAAGIACPASIALAAEKARRALEPKP